MFNKYRYLAAAMLAAGVWIATPACAAQTYGYRGGYYRDVQRRAYDNGYREGLEEGEKDARRGNPYEMTRHDEYRDADEGYHRSDGDRDMYRQAFRQGFQSGYDEAFRRNARYDDRYPRSTYPTYPAYPGPSYPSTPYPGGVAVPRYSSPAAQVGYRDGYEVGRNDGRDRESFDPIRSKRYRDGDNGYDRGYGPKEQYQRDYRSAFQQGYEQGYREYQRGR